MFSFQGAIRLGLPALPIRHRPNGDFYNISQSILLLQQDFSGKRNVFVRSPLIVPVATDTIDNVSHRLCGVNAFFHYC
jgi:hypothetical protein